MCYVDRKPRRDASPSRTYLTACSTIKTSCSESLQRLQPTGCSSQRNSSPTQTLPERSNGSTSTCSHEKLPFLCIYREFWYNFWGVVEYDCVPAEEICSVFHGLMSADLRADQEIVLSVCRGNVDSLKSAHRALFQERSFIECLWEECISGHLSTNFVCYIPHNDQVQFSDLFVSMIKRIADTDKNFFIGETNFFIGNNFFTRTSAPSIGSKHGPPRDTLLGHNRPQARIGPQSTPQMAKSSLEGRQ